MTAPAQESEIATASSRLWWVIPACVFLVLIGLAMLAGKPRDSQKTGDSYDASRQGLRAAYLLLEELDYPVERSKQPTGGAVRFVLFPEVSKDQPALVGAWVRAGGVVVLADLDGGFTKLIGLDVSVDEFNDAPAVEEASGAGIGSLTGGPIHVQATGAAGDTWAWAGGRPAVTVHRHGRGAIWLVNRPQFLSNTLLAQADNAILLCRLAEAASSGRDGRLAFDEYCHGHRDRPGVTELLLRPPMSWVTFQALLLMALLVWRCVPRFGAIQPAPPPRRRSKEEFLDAMASLLERKGARIEAYAAARADLVRYLEAELGLPAGTLPRELAQEAERRCGARPESLRPLWEAPETAGFGKTDFVAALNHLENIRDECTHRRFH